MSPESILRDGDGLLIVDVQADFCPGGALPIPQGDKVIPVLNAWLDAAKGKGVPVYASRDWHPGTHPSFEQHGGEWPAHCVQDSEGARFHADLRLPSDVVIISKGARFDKDQYSAFDDTGLEKELRRRGVRRLWIAGLAQDVCVKATALDARRRGFEVRLIEGGSLPLAARSGAEAIEEMKQAGVVVE